MKLSKGKNTLDERVDNINSVIHEKNKQIDELEKDIAGLYKDRLELQLHPFKLGDTVITEVQMGKTRKETECVLEAGGLGTLYVRPIKADGELSSRRFSLNPVMGKTYHDYIKKKQ